MTKFWQLLEDSVIIQGLLALGIVGVVLYQIVVGAEIPKELWGLTGMILGSYFTGKGVMQARNLAAKVQGRKE